MNIDIPLEDKQEIMDAFCSACNYKAVIEQIKNGEIVETNNPETPEDIMRQQIHEYVRQIHTAYKLKQARSSTKEIIAASKELMKKVKVTI